MRNAGFDLVSVQSEIRCCGVDKKEKRADKGGSLTFELKNQRRERFVDLVAEGSDSV